jgi:predicted PhzF superfamily epimerase YddE/YHI9
MNTDPATLAPDAYAPDDRFALTAEGRAYLDALDAVEDPAAGGAYCNDLAPLDDGAP